MRVHELAKKFGITSKKILALCKENGIKAANHMSGIEPPDVKILQKAAGGKPKAEEKKAEPKKKTKPEKKKTKPKKKAKAKEEKPDSSAIASEATAEAEPKEEKPEEKEPEPAEEKPKENVPAEEKKAVTCRHGTTVKNFSELIGQKAGDVIAKLIGLGVMTSINDPLEPEAMELVASEFGTKVLIEEEEFEEDEDEEPDRPEDLRHRAPVVTLLGHVDHGKTSLLDRIRKTNVAEQESGGITQHIGAYSVEHKGKRVVFLDTPGHKAFTAMRARGANITDVVVLVVASDDGVMPQTEEAIDHAKAAGVPVVVAVNKSDLPSANPNKVRQQLAALGLNPEEWGGETIFVDVSAKTGEKIDELLEMLALQTEILELKANPSKPARGTVIEIERSSKKGVIAHVLVQNGTLRKGDTILCGNTFGRVRALRDHTGTDIKEVGISSPAQLVGFQDVPEAGDRFKVVENIQKARAEAGRRRQMRREKAMVRRKHVTLENLYTSIAEDSLKEVRLIIKVDVHGSLEALQGALEQLNHEEVRINILHKGVGGINESDILLADASDAIVVGFHVVASSQAALLAEEKGVDVRTYSVIYEAVNSIRAAITGMLDPEERVTVVGRVTVRATFKISRIGTAAGCYVDNGTISRRDSMRLVRNGTVVHEGSMASLKRFKDDVTQVQSGYECGIRLEGFDDIKVGDTMEALKTELIAREA